MSNRVAAYLSNAQVRVGRTSGVRRHFFNPEPQRRSEALCSSRHNLYPEMPRDFERDDRGGWIGHGEWCSVCADRVMSIVSHRVHEGEEIRGWLLEAQRLLDSDLVGPVPVTGGTEAERSLYVLLRLAFTEDNYDAIFYAIRWVIASRPDAMVELLNEDMSPSEETGVYPQRTLSRR